jgi:hypothetical protein
MTVRQADGRSSRHHGNGFLLGVFSIAQRGPQDRIEVFVPTMDRPPIPIFLLGLRSLGQTGRRPIRMKRCIARLCSSIVTPLLGMAASALEYIIERAPEKGIAQTNYQPQSSSSGFQASIGNASTLIETVQCAGDWIDAKSPKRELRVLVIPATRTELESLGYVRIGDKPTAMYARRITCSGAH